MEDNNKTISRQVQNIITNSTVIGFVLLATFIGVIYYFAVQISHKWSQPSPVRVTEEQFNAY